MSYTGMCAGCDVPRILTNKKKFVVLCNRDCIKKGFKMDIVLEILSDRDFYLKF